MRHRLSIMLAATLALAPSGALAEVASVTDSGFVSHNEVLVDAAPQAAWDAMVRPAEWWNSEHSYSGDAANMSLEVRPGACFCETIPGSGGEIEHMRIVYVVPGSTLRLSGALGPLQSEAVTGILTMTLEPEGEMTRIRWDYVVGGYMRTPMGEMAPQVDRVVGEQLLRLATRLGAKIDPAARRF